MNKSGTPRIFLLCRGNTGNGLLIVFALNLSIQKGDHIDIISMNPSGLWKGKTRDGRVGNFKFINVEVLQQQQQQLNPDGTRRRRRSRRNSMASSRGGREQEEEEAEEEEEVEEAEPTTVEELLRKHDLLVY